MRRIRVSEWGMCLPSWKKCSLQLGIAHCLHTKGENPVPSVFFLLKPKILEVLCLGNCLSKQCLRQGLQKPLSWMCNKNHPHLPKCFIMSKFELCVNFRNTYFLSLTWKLQRKLFCTVIEIVQLRFCRWQVFLKQMVTHILERLNWSTGKFTSQGGRNNHIEPRHLIPEPWLVPGFYQLLCQGMCFNTCMQPLKFMYKMLTIK